MRTADRIVVGIVVLVTLSVAGPGSATPSSVPAGARLLDDGRIAYALRSSSPDWVTPELLAQARQGPTPAPAAAAPDVPASGFVGIRPGSFEVAPYGCTMDFIFQKGGQYFIGTAGHCVDHMGDDVTLLTVAPGTENPVLVDIGTVVARKFSDARIAPDYAIVSIRPELTPWVFPTIAVIGGPCGAYTGSGLAQIPIPRIFRGQDSAIGPEQVVHYGHGLGIGTGGTPRTGVSLYWESNAYYWDSPSIFGDSGSPVRVSNLQAAGNLTDLVVDSRRPGAVVEGTRISEFLAAGYSLVDSPYC